MKYFDFVMIEVHGLRIRELMDARTAGRKVFGSFCVFVPEELVLAVDGILVGLCAGAEFAPDEAEKLLPRNTCALIKGAFGFALAKVCPYLAAADMVVGENTCDGKKKSYEIFMDLVNDLYVMDLPQVKSDSGRELRRKEYLRFATRVEEVSGRTIETDALKKAIGTVNAKRSAMHRLAKLRAADPAPISGLDALLANQVFFYDDSERFTNSVNTICDELESRINRGEGAVDKGTPRILVSGCPMAVPNWKLPAIIENSGAVIVGEESCVGERGTQHLTSSDGLSVDALIENIVDRYLKIDCAVFTPNPSRLEHIRRRLLSRERSCNLVSEIKAVALGARFLSDECRAVLDVGGQDTKIVTLDEKGKLDKFLMNDRCAAGTGRFLEVMAGALSYTYDQFAEADFSAKRAEKLNSLCTVFAESEVISLVARGASRKSIALGIHEAIASRTLSMMKGLSLSGTILFAGGGAKNPCLRRCIEAGLGIPIHVPDNPRVVAALGAALCNFEN